MINIIIVTAFFIIGTMFSLVSRRRRDYYNFDGLDFTEQNIINRRKRT